jgi:ribonucleoside-diphosphate reductase beta chain
MFDPEGGPSIQRSDTVKYQSLQKLNQFMLSVFWRPEEVQITKDISDFKSMPENLKQIYTENLARSTVLDSIAGRSPIACFGPIASTPEVEAILTTHTFYELALHSASYSYIVKAVYPNPDVVFDSIKNIEQIVDLAKEASMYYDELHEHNVLRDAFNMGLIAESEYSLYEHKKAAWFALHAMNGLEAIRFYGSFAVFFSFAESGLMADSSRIIAMILRDEKTHVSELSQILNILPKEDPDFKQIKDECVEQVAGIYNDIITQELNWCTYIFRNGAILGLNEHILQDYVKFIGNNHMNQMGINKKYYAYNSPSANPLPWMRSYTEQNSVQVAPQESTLIAYTTGATKMDDLDNIDFEF